MVQAFNFTIGSVPFLLHFRMKKVIPLKSRSEKHPFEDSSIFANDHNLPALKHFLTMIAMPKLLF